jgi:triphosphatase
MPEAPENATAAPMEVELKLLLDVRDARKLLRHPAVAAAMSGQPRRVRLLSVYYDTPDCRLAHEQAALRLRKAGRRWVQTIKMAGEVTAGLHSRPEWEVNTRAGVLQLDGVPDGAMRELFADPALRSALTPRFTTAFLRTVVDLQWPEGDRVELAMDRGEVSAGGGTLPLCEVELELKAGRPGRLFELAGSLGADLRLQLCNVSKAERGYRLASGEPLQPSKASMPQLMPETGSGEACRLLLVNALAHLQANEEGGRQAESPEFIHQLRVAVRRLRCVMAMFGPLMEEAFVAAVETDLAWLAHAMDEARNWDVFMDEALPPVRAAVVEDAGMDWLAAQGAAQRQAHRLLAREALGSLRYQRLLLRLGAWLADPVWNPATMTTSLAPLRLTAAELLQQGHQRLKRRGRSFARLDVEERHELRIVAKRLRYATEYFACLYPGRRVDRYIRALGRLQAVLGEMNDGATTARLVQQLAGSSRSAVRQRACGLVMGWLLGREQSLMRGADKAWVRYAECSRFWNRSEKDTED